MRWVLFLLVPWMAQAQGLPNCQIESIQSARATCLKLEGEIRLAEMDRRIETLIGGVQGATPAAQQAFEEAIRDDQADWWAEVEAFCEAAESRLDKANCAIVEISAREAQLDEALAPLEEQAYGLPFTTDGVEIFVPLDGGAPEPFLTLEDILTRP